MSQTLEEFAAAQKAEYGTYVAREAISYNGVRAFNAGDAVPVSHVVEHGYDRLGLVTKVSTAPVAPAASVVPTNTDTKE